MPVTFDRAAESVTGLKMPLPDCGVFFSFGGTLFALQVCVILFSESHTMDFPENRNPPGVGHLLLLGGILLARRDRRLALVLALRALAVRAEARLLLLFLLALPAAFVFSA